MANRSQELCKKMNCTEININYFNLNADFNSEKELKKKNVHRTRKSEK